jgi:hypothetical protein
MAITQRTVLVRVASVDGALVNEFRAFMEGSIGLGRVIAAGGVLQVVDARGLAGTVPGSAEVATGDGEDAAGDV